MSMPLRTETTASHRWASSLLRQAEQAPATVGRVLSQFVQRAAGVSSSSASTRSSFGDLCEVRGAREPRERTASETGSPTRYVRVVLDVNDVTERGGLIGTFDLTKTRGR